MQIAVLIFVLLILVVISGAASRLVRVPLPVLQIALGAALAWPVGGIHIAVEPELFLLVFIPPLLFRDAFAAPKRELWELRRPIVALAVGLVCFTVLGFGYALHWLVPSVPLAVAFALAAVVSPTDAVAVSSIVDRNSVPSRLMHILEGESLLNDASGLVMFRFAVAAVLTGHFSIASASASFLYAVVAGVLCGVVALFVVTKSLKLIGRIGGVPTEVQVILMVLLPFAAYLMAEAVEASGILAAVAAGLLVGRFTFIGNISVAARIQANSFWSMLAFIFNGAVFVLLGLQLPDIIRRVPPEISSRHAVIEPVATMLLLTLCLIVLRYLWIWASDTGAVLLARLRGTTARPFGVRVRLAGSVAGVRGAVTLAGILSLPFALPDGAPFPARDAVIFLAAGVIICSLLLASLTLPVIAKGLVEPGEDTAAIEERRAWIAAADAAIAYLEGMAAVQDDDPQAELRSAAAQSIIAGYRSRIATCDEADDVRKQARQSAEVETRLRLAAIKVEHEVLRQMLKRREINDRTMRRLQGELTLSEALLRDRKSHR
ncbi:Na+/H+ antiporter [Mesorhizobium sp. SP-1A]|uniref:Na+/H+ antiporter n=1 Tax=Mesorhizobium sp. SP-1A TaxID=3077840 RepID=UPI0028F73342|nr:Na+/H+ antiporter [Mesorhizobium sp. SP-1A]